MVDDFISFPKDHFSLEEICQAYFDCRKDKRKSKEVIRFEYKLENNLVSLWKDLNNGNYHIGKSKCFVISSPKYREVWAGQFRDRIVHNVIYNRIFNIFVPGFIYDSYACLPNKGTLFGVQRIDKFIRKSTQNYQYPSYYLQADLKNFFVSINKSILNKLINQKVNEKHLIDLINKIIFHDPTINPIYNSPKSEFFKIPFHKSLFNSSYYNGLPIGNLTSQFFANIYLNELDQFIKKKLKIKFYGRYIDDIILVHQDKNYLHHCYEQIEIFAFEKLRVEFHPDKTSIDSVYNGIDFCGQIILPYRRYIRKRTVKTLKPFFLQDDSTKIDTKTRINTYLGILKWCNSYNLKERLIKDVDLLFDKNIHKIQCFNH